MEITAAPHAHSNKTSLVVGGVSYLLLLVAFWVLVRHFALSQRLGHMPSTFTAFSLILAPYWFFGFGLAETIRRILPTRLPRVFASSLLALPYLIYALPRGEFRWVFLFVFLFVPAASNASFEYGSLRRPLPAGLCWQDVLVLAAVGVPVEFHLVEAAFPHPGLTSLSKLLLVDSALYSFLVVRLLEGVGYDFRPKLGDFVIGVRELLSFAPIVIGLGLALHFITPHGGLPSPASAFSAVVITLFFVAIPEELFFRGLLQNLLEPRIGRSGGLWVSAVIFGLSHFNKPLPFNWRYVLLATIAGVFYGRAWRSRRRLLASATTHACVDVLWSLWFR
ncbi:MAG TPA: CPBP family intramembrane glutamic endopeptidase [Terriglobales bacterium]|nr:CPBP family intramembrane glutamic endopeptidase [Terriglobales bacterium]